MIKTDGGTIGRWLASREKTGRISPQSLRCRSWLGVLNFYVLQWAGLRLGCIVDDEEKIVAWEFHAKPPLKGWTKLGETNTAETDRVERDL